MFYYRKKSVDLFFIYLYPRYIWPGNAVAMKKTCSMKTVSMSSYEVYTRYSQVYEQGTL